MHLSILAIVMGNDKKRRYFPKFAAFFILKKYFYCIGCTDDAAVTEKGMLRRHLPYVEKASAFRGRGGL